MDRQHVLTVTKADLDIQTFRAGGPGGQHQNKTDSAVRIIHRESGAVGESRSDRSQHVNKRLAFRRMTESLKFRAWIARKAAEAREGQSLEEKVDEMLKPENLRVEGLEGEAWVEIPN